ncbi:MAG: tRNA (mo5U34)-methyltransferase, partial [Acidimicrobiaceae bacterium]
MSEPQSWYHTIELPGGVVTPGEYDLRSVVDKVGLPARLDGTRCLDVGTHDGFWAFEMERRGAREVVALDVADPAELDWPEPRPELTDDVLSFLLARKRAFGFAAQALGS